MPELPDITVYVDALSERILGKALERAHVQSAFLLRSVDPGVEAAVGHRVVALERLGKRIAFGFDNGVWFVLHLMIAGRLHWRGSWPERASRQTLLLLGFDAGTLTLTEAGTQKRASLYVVRGRGCSRRARSRWTRSGGLDGRRVSLPRCGARITP